MPVKEMVKTPEAPLSTRKRIQTDDAPELMETPLPIHGPEETSKRRMPENLRKYLLRVQGGKFYLPAAYRIVWFRDECPDWGIATTLVEGGYEAGFATVKAEIFNPEGRLVASDYKTESKQDFPAGWVEKAATGAIARALALTGFGTQFAPELDEEVFADSPQPIGRDRFAQSSRYAGNGGVKSAALRVREESAAKEMRTGIWDGPGQCPSCHAPAGKPHGKQCAH